MGEAREGTNHNGAVPDTEDGILALSKVIKDAHHHYIREKKGELYKFLLEIIERSLIEEALLQSDGNQLEAARILGINRNTIHTKIAKLKINVDEFKDYKPRK